MVRIVLFIVIWCASLAAHAQHTLVKADEAFASDEYAFAIQYYKTAFEQANSKTTSYADIAYKIAVCYAKISQSADAQTWFEKAIELKYDNPEVYVLCADMMRMNEKFTRARKMYATYKQLAPGNAARAELGIQSCDFAQKCLQEPTKYHVSRMKALNSLSMDYSPYIVQKGSQNELYFSSSRSYTQGDRVHGASGQKFSDIFSATETVNNTWLEPVQLSAAINSIHDEGTPSLSADMKTMYFTQCQYLEKTVSFCRIMTAQKEKYDWNMAIPLVFSAMETDSANYVHPSISHDELTLYFSSNRTGGFGGYDIWFVTRNSTSDEWSAPHNAGQAINTAGDEVFPYIQSNGTVYFASNGHIGMGGLDIFMYAADSVKNIGAPINSTFDDYGITVLNAEEGYFSSNRPQKNQPATDDIYQFLLPYSICSLSGIVVNELSNEAIAQAHVRIIGSDGSEQNTLSNSKGEYSFELSNNCHYVLSVTHDDFLTEKYQHTTFENPCDTKMNMYVYQINMPIEVPHVMYDVSRWELRPESIIALKHLLDVLNDNPQIVIELSSHTDYRQGTIDNEELSQRRAQSVVDYLIAQGVNPKRLAAKGYAATQPKQVDLRIAKLYGFLHVGTKLTPEFIDSLPAEQREICHQINRRTEFRVITTNF